MQDAALDHDAQPTTEGPKPLVRHTRREDWGRALMLWEREEKRGYQFEDGELRVFAEPYYKFLQPAKQPDPVLRYKLREQAAANGFVSEAAKKARAGNGGKAVVQLPDLDDQVTVFEAMYPDGFHGVAWTDAHRSRLDKRALKRHRDEAIVSATDRLSPEALGVCIDAGNYGEVLTRVVDVVNQTDLATRQQLDTFTGIEVTEELASAMVGYLHDVRDGDLTTMARLRRALAKAGVRKLAWTALTAARALLHPNDHMCVRPSVVRSQAKLILTNYRPSPTPNAAEYSRCLEIAMTVRQHLTDAGFAPRDLFDVTAFMKETLSPKFKEQLTEAMVLRNTGGAVEATPEVAPPLTVASLNS